MSVPVFTNAWFPFPNAILIICPKLDIDVMLPEDHDFSIIEFTKSGARYRKDMRIIQVSVYGKATLI